MNTEEYTGDQNYDFYLDHKVEGKISNCCGAIVVFKDTCVSCREHCQPINEEDYE